MSSQNDKSVLLPSLNPLKYHLTLVCSLFQSQRRAWRYLGDYTTDPALALLIRGPMEDVGQLLTITQDLLRKLMDLSEIKMKQLEIEARTSGKEWLGSKTDIEKTSKFATATRVHSDYRKHIMKLWEDGLNMLPELQARFKIMQDTLEKPDVPKPIEALTPSLKPFIQAAVNINDRVWAFESKLVGILRTVDEGLAFAAVAVTCVKYPEADQLAQERYGASCSSDYGQELGA